MTDEELNAAADREPAITEVEFEMAMHNLDSAVDLVKEHVFRRRGGLLFAYKNHPHLSELSKDFNEFVAEIGDVLYLRAEE